MKNIAVYLGSSESADSFYKDAAYTLGEALASNGFTVIYGGAGIGSMKSLADGALSKNGKVIGVIPEGFIEQIRHKYPDREFVYNALGEDVAFVKNLSERKQKMESLSDCSVTLPGGGGTMDELFEYLVDRQLGYHDKPMFILNLNGFYNPLIDLLKNMREANFIKDKDIELMKFVSSIDELIHRLKDLEKIDQKGSFSAYY